MRVFAMMTCSEKCKRVSSMIGSMLIFFFGRPFLYWGNLSLYMMSYQLLRGQPGYALQPSWFLLIYSASWAMGTLLTDVSSNAIAVRTRIFIGIVLYNLCFFGSAFSHRISWVMYMTAFGICSGFGIGMFEIAVLKNYVTTPSFRDGGFLAAIYLSSGAVGAAALNFFVTWWVNPWNLWPDAETAGILLFSQDELLNRVPNMFYVIGGVSLGMQILGFCLLQDYDETSDGDTIDSNASPTAHYRTFGSRHFDDREMSVFDTVNPGDGLASFDICEINETSATQEDNNTIISILRSRNFLKLWFLYFCAAHSRIIINVYYKFFGQSWIRNDSFLSDIGIVMPLTSMFSVVVWGVILDMIGFKSCVRAVMFCLSVVSFSMYMTLGHNHWSYLIITVIGLNVSNSVFFCFVVATAKLLGTQHLGRKVALVSTAPFLTYCLSSIIFEFSMAMFGWVFLFMWVGSWSVVGLIASIVTLSSFSFRGK